jgi:predicted porin
LKEESNTTTTFGSTAFVVYSILLRGAKAVPYIGAQYFKSDFSNGDDKGSVGINVGMKYYFAKKTAFDVSGNYLFTLNDNSQGGIILFAVGLSFLL